MRILSLVVLLGGLAIPASAQTPIPTAGGLWWEVSVSAAGHRLNCLLCTTTRDFGPSLSGAVGAYASDHLRVGLEGEGWTNVDGANRENAYRAGVVAHLHPRRDRGFYVVGGLGWSAYRVGTFTYDAARVTLGAGWDLPLLPDWIVGNRLTLDGASYATLRNDGSAVSRNVGMSMVRFGVYLRRR